MSLKDLDTLEALLFTRDNVLMSNKTKRALHQVLKRLRQEEAQVATGCQILRTVLKRARWDDQGGYVSYLGNREWAFVSGGLPQATPDEWNALFDLAGITPDVIQSLGSCEECAHAKVFPDGSRAERGYERPCLTCKRPKMSNFEPLVKITKKAS